MITLESRKEIEELYVGGDLEAALLRTRELEDWYNESVILAKMRRYQEAVQAAEKGIPQVSAYKQLMSIYWELGDRENARKYIELGLSLDPYEPDLRVARGTWVLAARPSDPIGWEDIEYRPWARSQKEMYDEVPEWNGEPLTDKSLLIVYQDGIGDQIMFSRFIDDIEKLGAERIVVFADPQLAKIFYESYTVEVVGLPEQIGDVDYWIGMSSLGKFGYPILSKPYLFVPDGRREKFLACMNPAPSTRMRVGLVWAGQPKHTQDRNRSIPFSWLEPLLQLPADFYSLQFGKDNLQHQNKLAPLSTYCKDVADTAAAIKNLDLVIGVDTGIIHIAGAIGVPAWVICKTPIDWRWGLEGGSTYWYDSVSVLRNPTIDEIYTRLHTLTLSYSVVKDVLPPLPVVSSTKAKYGEMEYFTHDLWCGRAIEEYGEWSDQEVQLMKLVLDKDSVVLEAGANIGAHTLALAQHVRHVLAFEPQEHVFQVLVNNVRRSGVSNVSLGQAALGPERAMAAYEYANPALVVNPGAVKVTNEVGSKNSVQVVSIDSLGLKHLHMIKADVEGMEYQVLVGAQLAIEKFRPLLYVENNDAAERNDLYRLIDALGYRMYQHTIPLYNPNNYKENVCNVFGMWTSQMVFCVPKERYDLRSLTRQLQRIRI